MNEIKTKHDESLEKRLYWGPIIEDWKKSNLSATQYCKNNQLDIYRFKYWQHRIAPETKKPSRHKVNKKISFKPIEVVDAPTVSKMKTHAGLCFELHLCNGMKLSIPTTLDKLGLQSLFACLGVI